MLNRSLFAVLFVSFVVLGALASVTHGQESPKEAEAKEQRTLPRPTYQTHYFSAPDHIEIKPDGSAAVVAKELKDPILKDSWKTKMPARMKVRSVHPTKGLVDGLVVTNSGQTPVREMEVMRPQYVWLDQADAFHVRMIKEAVQFPTPLAPNETRIIESEDTPVCYTKAAFVMYGIQRFIVEVPHEVHILADGTMKIVSVPVPPIHVGEATNQLPNMIKVLSILPNGESRPGAYHINRSGKPCRTISTQKPNAVFLNDGLEFELRWNEIDFKRGVDLPPNYVRIIDDSDIIPIYYNHDVPRYNKSRTNRNENFSYNTENLDASIRNAAGPAIERATGSFRSILRNETVPILFKFKLVTDFDSEDPTVMQAHVLYAGGAADLFKYAQVRPQLIDHVDTTTDNTENAILGQLPAVGQLHFYSFSPPDENLYPVESFRIHYPLFLKWHGGEMMSIDIEINSKKIPEMFWDTSKGAVPLSKFDFESMLVHETIHAIGFDSAADDNKANFKWRATTWDLFRLRNDDPLIIGRSVTAAAFRTYPRMLLPYGAMAVTALQDPSRTFELSSGLSPSGDTSHWLSRFFSGNWLGVMDEYVAHGPAPVGRPYMTDADLRAVDLIGWDTDASYFAPVAPKGGGMLPPNGADSIPVQTTLQWSNPGGVCDYLNVFVYNGSPGDGNIVFSQENLPPTATSITIPKGKLAGLTTYSWVIVSVNATSTTQSDIQYFQTEYVPDVTGHWSDRFGSIANPDGHGVGGSVFALTTFDDGSGPSLFAGGLGIWTEYDVYNGISKWNGTAWSPIGPNSAICLSTGCGGEIYRMCSYDDDGPGPNPACLAIAGWFDTAGGNPSYSVARWNPVTQQYLPIGAGLDCQSVGNTSCSSVYAAVSWDPDGPGPGRPRLVVGGDFDITLPSGGPHLKNIACWVPEAGQWEALGGELPYEVYDLLVHDNGSGPKLYAATYGVAQFNGTAWQTVGTSDDYVYCLATFDSDGPGSQPTALYAGGEFSVMDSTPAWCIASWNGAAWSDVGGGMDVGSSYPPQVRSLAVLDPDGAGPAPEKLYAAGLFFMAGGTSVNNIARLDGSVWAGIGSGVASYYSNEIVAIVYTLSPFNDPTESLTSLYAGGGFDIADGIYWSYNIAQWIPRCVGDFNDDGFVGGDDFDAFVIAFDLADPSADIDGDGFVTGDDFDAFVASFEAGC